MYVLTVSRSCTQGVLIYFIGPTCGEHHARRYWDCPLRLESQCFLHSNCMPKGGLHKRLTSSGNKSMAVSIQTGPLPASFFISLVIVLLVCYRVLAVFVLSSSSKLTMVGRLCFHPITHILIRFVPYTASGSPCSRHWL